MRRVSNNSCQDRPWNYSELSDSVQQRERFCSLFFFLEYTVLILYLRSVSWSEVFAQATKKKIEEEPVLLWEEVDRRSFAARRDKDSSFAKPPSRPSLKNHPRAFLLASELSPRIGFLCNRHSKSNADKWANRPERLAADSRWSFTSLSSLFPIVDFAI